MPTYTYLCKSCGHEFEELQKISEALLVRCPNCGKKKLARIIGGGGGLVFKGSGFYLTDYKKKPTSPATSETPKSSEKKETKTEVKKDTPKESKQ